MEEDEPFALHLGVTPAVVVEIVFNINGGENAQDGTLGIYGRMKVEHYIVYVPGQQKGSEPLRIYMYRGGHLVRTNEAWFDDIGLGVTLWRGEYQGCESPWLRWCDRDGVIIPTGEAAKERAETEHARAEAERERAERLAANLRAAGIDPDA